MGKGRELQNELPYLVTHALLVVASFIGCIVFAIASSDPAEQFKYGKDGARLFDGWGLGVSILSLIYAILAVVNDFKSQAYDYDRNHRTFLFLDIFLVIVLLPFALTGAVLWADDGDTEYKAYNTGIVSLWGDWFLLVLILLQDRARIDD